MSAPDELLDYLFDGKDAPLRADFAGWLRDSRRFGTFAANYRDKIRSKLRNVRDEGGTRGLAAELEAAALLLREERFTLEYEKYAATKRRGPDFTATYRSHTTFNVEVRRIRGVELGDEDAESRVGRLMGVLCGKVGQMPPSIVNLLWLIGEREISDFDLTRATSTLRELAESKAEAYFSRRGFEGAADFLRQYQRLSGVVLRHPDGNVVWLNPLARHEAPPEIVAAIERLCTI